MLDLQTIAENIEESLNALGDFTFKIYANAGEYQSEHNEYARRFDNTIYGILAAVAGSTIVPVKGLNSYSTALELQLAANFNIKDDLYDLLTLYVQQHTGASSIISDYAAVVSFDIPTVGQIEQNTPMGRCLPISLPIYYQFIQNGVLSNDVEVRLNDEELMVLSSAFIRGRTASTNWLMGKEEMQSAIGQQGLMINVVLAYSKGGIVEQLASDIISGKLVQTYTMTYNDGNVSKSWQVLLQDGSINTEAQKVASVSVSFLIAREDIYSEVTNG